MAFIIPNTSSPQGGTILGKDPNYKESSAELSRRLREAAQRLMKERAKKANEERARKYQETLERLKTIPDDAPQEAGIAIELIQAEEQQAQQQRERRTADWQKAEAERIRREKEAAERKRQEAERARAEAEAAQRDRGQGTPSAPDRPPGAAPPGKKWRRKVGGGSAWELVPIETEGSQGMDQIQVGSSDGTFGMFQSESYGDMYGISAPSFSYEDLTGVMSAFDPYDQSVQSYSEGRFAGDLYALGNDVLSSDYATVSDLLISVLESGAYPIGTPLSDKGRRALEFMINAAGSLPEPMFMSLIDTADASIYATSIEEILGEEPEYEDYEEADQPTGSVQSNAPAFTVINGKPAPLKTKPLIKTQRPSGPISPM